MDYHPFLFATILFSIRYGIWEGVLSGVLGAGIIIWATFSQSDFIEMEFLYGLDSMSLPLIILLFGILIGETTESRNKKLEYYQGTLKKEVSAHLAKSKEAKGLQESLLQLEKKLAGHGLGIHDFSDHLIEIFYKQDSKFYEFIQEILKTYLHVEESYILISSPDVYHQKGIDGHFESIDEEMIKQLSKDPIYQASMEAKKPMALTEHLDEIDEKAENFQYLFYCGPIMKDEHSIDAMVVVKKIPFIDFNVTNFRLFEVILKTASLAKEKQNSYMKLYDVSPYHETWMVEREHYFFNNLKLALEYSKEVDIVLAGFDFMNEVQEDMKEGFLMLLSQLCQGIGVRVGYIVKIQGFAFYKEMGKGSDEVNALIQRYQNYGFSQGFAKLRVCSLNVKTEEIKREQAYLMSKFEKAFMQTEIAT